MELKQFDVRKYLFPFNQPPKDPNAPRYGDVLDRAMAAAIDLGVLYFMFHKVFEWFSYKLYARADRTLIGQASASDNAGESFGLLWQSGLVHLWFINAAIQLVIIGMFLVGMQVLWQATPGKWIMGLKIVRRKTLAPIAPWRYLLRYVAYIPAALPLMIGIIWASFNKERRGWHDMIAGTVVINTRPYGWYWQQCKKGFRWLYAKLKPAANDNHKPKN
jgi:hypothetical protein